MAQIGVAPIILTNVLFQVETDTYEKHVSTVEFVPSSSVVTWKGLTPASVFSAGTTATWTCNLSFAQDWETADSLSLYLFENEGEEIDVTFEPVNGGAGFTATLIVTPGSIGGAVDSVAVSTVTLGVRGKPVHVPAA
jgi:hypothetical protein